MNDSILIENEKITTCFAWTHCGKVDNVDDKLTCPHCTKIMRYIPWHDSLGSQPVEVNPVFLIRRVNKRTNDWFFGCPNFPKCKYSKNRPKTKQEKDIMVRASMNAIDSELEII